MFIICKFAFFKFYKLFTIIILQHKYDLYLEGLFYH